MKRTLLILSLIALGFNANAQVFGTGAINFNSNFSASVSISGATNTTTLTLVVPSNVWFSVGFGGSNMSAGADVFRSDGTTITDAKSTGRFLPTADSQQDWSLQSNSVSGSTRTMVVTRANNTGDSNDFVFNPNTGNLTMIWAHGSSTSYAYHGGNRGATVAGVLSTLEANRLDFEMYPNPASESLTIQLPSGSSNATVQFYDQIGKLALTRSVTSSSNTINVNNLSTGIYILKVLSDDKIGTQKFIKQ
ncbi:MAG: T9SS type A sorting domain-containing protein [Polaribacter sp.]|uniref:T9SS type A sorting domain-containing protein n=1 Tax=Polaribacter sp. TaxID=1920175 RepID=UPI003BB21352